MTKGWKMPENTLYVGRPTKWGNPHKVGVSLTKEPNGSKFDYRKMSATDAVNAYRETIIWHIANNPEKYNIEKLRGKNLACWCKEGEPCHADILLKIANG